MMNIINHRGKILLKCGMEIILGTITEFFPWYYSDTLMHFFLSNYRGFKLEIFLSNYRGKYEITKEGFRPELFACRVLLLSFHLVLIKLLVFGMIILCLQKNISHHCHYKFISRNLNFSKKFGH
jgi:hypothetical protein